MSFSFSAKSKSPMKCFWRIPENLKEFFVDPHLLDSNSISIIFPGLHAHIVIVLLYFFWNILPIVALAFVKIKSDSGKELSIWESICYLMEMFPSNEKISYGFVVGIQTTYWDARELEDRMKGKRERMYLWKAWERENLTA